MIVDREILPTALIGTVAFLAFAVAGFFTGKAYSAIIELSISISFIPLIIAGEKLTSPAKAYFLLACWLISVCAGVLVAGYVKTEIFTIIILAALIILISPILFISLKIYSGSGRNTCAI